MGISLRAHKTQDVTHVKAHRTRGHLGLEAQTRLNCVGCGVRLVSEPDAMGVTCFERSNAAAETKAEFVAHASFRASSAITLACRKRKRLVGGLGIWRLWGIRSSLFWRARFFFFCLLFFERGVGDFRMAS